VNALSWGRVLSGSEKRRTLERRLNELACGKPHSAFGAFAGKKNNTVLEKKLGLLKAWKANRGILSTKIHKTWDLKKKGGKTWGK